MRKSILGAIGIAFVALFCFVVTGCGSNSEKGLIGKWYYVSGSSTYDDIYYTFNADKSGSYTFYDTTNKFTYEDDGTKVTLNYKEFDNQSELKYSIKDGILTIEDSFGEEVTYKKK